MPKKITMTDDEIWEIWTRVPRPSKTAIAALAGVSRERIRQIIERLEQEDKERRLKDCDDLIQEAQILGFYL